MKIYTKTGDQGQTSLFAGGRVRKDHGRVQIYGTLDEANSTLGMAIALLGPNTTPQAREKMTRIQNELFALGSELATPDLSKLKIKLVGDFQIADLENDIDQMEKQLKPLQAFILPGGSAAAAAVHLCRTIIRRAEREMVTVMDHETFRPEALKYMNRLSDFLFVLGRAVNYWEGGIEVEWHG